MSAYQLDYGSDGNLQWFDESTGKWRSDVPPPDQQAPQVNQTAIDGLLGRGAVPTWDENRPGQVMGYATDNGNGSSNHYDANTGAFRLTDNTKADSLLQGLLKVGGAGLGIGGLFGSIGGLGAASAAGDATMPGLLGADGGAGLGESFAQQFAPYATSAAAGPVAGDAFMPGNLSSTMQAPGLDSSFSQYLTPQVASPLDMGPPQTPPKLGPEFDKYLPPTAPAPFNPAKDSQLANEQLNLPPNFDPVNPAIPSNFLPDGTGPGTNVIPGNSITDWFKTLSAADALKLGLLGTGILGAAASGNKDTSVAQRPYTGTAPQTFTPTHTQSNLSYPINLPKGKGYANSGAWRWGA